MTGRIYVAVVAFDCSIGGKQFTVNFGDTVREGHPLLSKNRDYFAPQVVKFEHKEAPAKSVPPKPPEPTAPARRPVGRPPKKA